VGGGAGDECGKIHLHDSQYIEDRASGEKSGKKSDGGTLKKANKPGKGGVAKKEINTEKDKKKKLKRCHALNR